MPKTLELVSTAYEPGQMPDYPEVQIALAGRSNVGKSSLVNCLAGRKALAKISSTPGKTRSLNFYQVVPEGFYLVDLPGYGFARSSKAEKEKWGKLIEAYLTGRNRPAAVVCLLDSRLEPQRLDLEMAGFLTQNAIPLIAVLTKADKCKQREVAERQRQWREILRLPELPLSVSSRTGRGRAELWRALCQAAGCAVEPPKTAPAGL
jgi:GTP-binding protein